MSAKLNNNFLLNQIGKMQRKYDKTKINTCNIEIRFAYY